MPCVSQYCSGGPLPALSGVCSEQEPQVRLRAVRLLGLLATKATGAHSADLLDILERIVKRLSEPPGTDTAVLFTRQDFDWQLEAVRGLIQCLKVKFCSGPGLLARRCYYSLVTALDKIYDRPLVVEQTEEVRL